MQYFLKNNDIILVEKDLDLAQTLDCGQAFRFQTTEKGFSGFAQGNFLDVEKDGDNFRFKNMSEEIFLSFWADYFDLYTDYSALKSAYSSDETLKKATLHSHGIRLLKQDSWEALCSFIISQHNSIRQIKLVVQRLCEHFGEKNEYGFAFPSAEKLAMQNVDDLIQIKCGFRAKYILDAAKKVASKEVDLTKIKLMDLDTAKKELIKIVGVGEKVANCALLFGMYKTDAFPVDVWIKRVLERFYPNGFPTEFEKTKGIAQQYLFNYIRNLDE